MTGMSVYMPCAGYKVTFPPQYPEKGFQPGRKVLEEKGARVESLAIIEKMGNGTITFKEQDD